MRSAWRTVESRCAMTMTGHVEIAERGADDRLRLVVERAGRLVEQQDARAARDGARDHDPLPLAAGQRVDAFGDHGVHAHRHRLDVVVETGEPRRLPGVFERQLDAAANVVVDAPRRQFAVLQHDAELTAHRADIERVDGLAVEEYGARLRFFEAQQQPEQRGFAAARRTDDGDIFARRDPEARRFRAPADRPTCSERSRATARPFRTIRPAISVRPTARLRPKSAAAGG